MPIHKVAIIGASGTLGPAVLSALQSTPSLQVTVLSRASSKATFSAPTKTVPDDFSVSALTSILQGFDALVSTLPGSTVEPHKNLASACAAAGVQRFVPADFGSVDSSDPVVAALVPLYKQKGEVRAHCERLAAESGGKFSWTSLVTGHFFDWGLKLGLLGVQLRQGKATVYDDGETKWSATTLARIGEAVAKVLTTSEEVARNKMLYIQSFCVSQLDIIEGIMRTSARQIEVSFVKSQPFIEDKKERSNAGDRSATEDLVSVLGLTRANWEGKADFANKLLGFENEDLDEVLKEVHKSLIEDQAKK